jgi:uncharacterized membrane protein YidH (DUF202 family)
MTKCKQNIIINRIFGMGLQIFTMFIFLTVFFFTYVKLIEKQSFVNQINLVVDDLATDQDFNKLKPPEGSTKDALLIVIDGSLDLAKQKSIKQSQKTDQNISKQNEKTLRKAVKWVIIAIILVIVIIITIKAFRVCLPISTHIKDSLVTLFFIALTEFLFLTIITSKYWSINRQQVRKDLGESIHKYISDNNLNPKN